MRALRAIRRAALCAAGAAAVSCSRPRPHVVEPAFYYWRASFGLDSAERATLREDSARVLYLRFFDVGWNDAASQPAPVAPVRFTSALPAGLSLVAVIFITQEALEKCTPPQITPLADHLWEKALRMDSTLGAPLKALQLDCDWTASTREKYFALLRALASRAHHRGVALEVTLRLHQIKYAAATGVPPADRGMLMLYNTGDWKNPATTNALFDPETIARYLGTLDAYPLPLDLALPLVRWTIVYRGGHFLTFLNGLDRAQLEQASFLRSLADPARFRVKTDTFAWGCALRRGDLLRAESCGFRELMATKRMTLDRIRNARLRLALFHLDDTLLTHYTHAEMQAIFSSVQ